MEPSTTACPVLTSVFPAMLAEETSPAVNVNFAGVGSVFAFATVKVIVPLQEAAVVVPFAAGSAPNL